MQHFDGNILLQKNLASNRICLGLSLRFMEWKHLINSKYLEIKILLDLLVLPPNMWVTHCYDLLFIVFGWKSRRFDTFCPFVVDTLCAVKLVRRWKCFVNLKETQTSRGGLFDCSKFAKRRCDCIGKSWDENPALPAVIEPWNRSNDTRGSPPTQTTMTTRLHTRFPCLSLLNIGTSFSKQFGLTN